MPTHDHDTHHSQSARASRQPRPPPAQGQRARVVRGSLGVSPSVTATRSPRSYSRPAGSPRGASIRTHDSHSQSARANRQGVARRLAIRDRDAFAAQLLEAGRWSQRRIAEILTAVGRWGPVSRDMVARARDRLACGIAIKPCSERACGCGTDREHAPDPPKPRAHGRFGSVVRRAEGVVPCAGRRVVYGPSIPVSGIPISEIPSQRDRIGSDRVTARTQSPPQPRAHGRFESVVRRAEGVVP